MSLSNTVETEMLTDFLTRHPTLYLALSTADPGEDGSTISEPSAGTGYVRQLVGAVTLSGSTISNNNDIQFPAATGDQGTLTYGALFTAGSGGTFLGYASITSTPCPAGTVIVVAASTPLMTLD